MPPKKAEEAPSTEVFVFEKDRSIRKMYEESYVTRNKIMETKCVTVKPRPKKDPAEKLKERIATYKNLRKMRTDYKNFVKYNGGVPPSFYVPEILWRV